MGLKYRDMLLSNNDMGNTNVYDGYAVTPNDTLATYQTQVPYQNGQPKLANAILATGVGNINLVLDAYGNTAVLTVAAAGVNNVIPIDFMQVKATSTTATGISALFRE